MVPAVRDCAQPAHRPSRCVILNVQRYDVIVAVGARSRGAPPTPAWPGTRVLMLDGADTDYRAVKANFGGMGPREGLLPGKVPWRLSASGGADAGRSLLRDWRQAEFHWTTKTAPV